MEIPTGTTRGWWRHWRDRLSTVESDGDGLRMAETLTEIVPRILKTGGDGLRMAENLTEIVPGLWRWAEDGREFNGDSSEDCGD